jgi:hypothetical protein
MPVGARPAVSDEAPELASYIIIMTLGKEALRNFKPMCHIGIRRVGRLGCAQRFDLSLNGRGLSNSRSSEDNDRVSDGVLFKQEFGLEVIDLEAYAAYIIAVEKIQILISLPITRAFQDGFDSLLCIRILFNRLWSLLRQWFAAMIGMWRRWNF